MTALPTPRRAVLGLATLTALGSLVGIAPAQASPSYDIVCASASAEAPRTTLLTFDLGCEDLEGNPVEEYVVVTPPTKALTFSLNATTGAVSYQPLPNANGTDTFSFKGVSGLEESAVTTVVITIDNSGPVCGDVDTVRVRHDRPTLIPLVCSDPDGDALTVSTGTTGAAHGTVTVVGEYVAYTPATGYTGPDAFTLRASDGDLFSEEVPVAVNVTNATPVCKARGRGVIKARGKATVHMSCRDGDNDRVTKYVAQEPEHGRLVKRAHGWYYVPDRGYVGRDEFRLRGTDGLATSKPVEFRVYVRPRRKG